MRLRDVKIGELYRHVYNDSAASEAIEIIEPDDKSRSAMVLLREPDGKETLIRAIHLTPSAEWQEHVKKQEQRAETDNKEAEQLTSQIAEIVGGTISRHSRWGGGHGILIFDETAADNILNLLSAKPIPNHRRPSNAVPNSPEFYKRCRLTALRLRRALGAGHAAKYFNSSPWMIGHVGVSAQLSMTLTDMQDVAQRLQGDKPSDSALSSLLS